MAEPDQTKDDMSAGDDLVTWTMPREDARDLLRWLRHNRPLGMPDRTVNGLIDSLSDPPSAEIRRDLRDRSQPPADGEQAREPAAPTTEGAPR